MIVASSRPVLRLSRQHHGSQKLILTRWSPTRILCVVVALAAATALTVDSSPASAAGLDVASSGQSLQDQPAEKPQQPPSADKPDADDDGPGLAPESEDREGDDDTEAPPDGEGAIEGEQDTDQNKEPTAETAETPETEATDDETVAAEPQSAPPPPVIPDLSPSQSLHGSQLTPVARFEILQPTGIAISEGSRFFINFPLWSDSHLFALVELLSDGSIVPFPDAWSNAWRERRTPVPAEEAFVSVQSVWADGRGGLWILDSGSPRMEKIVPGGPKLIGIDLANSDVVHALDFGPDAAPEGSYLNDVRVDPDRQFAYISDSGLGAILVIDLQHGIVRRVLADHPSTKAEAGMEIRIGGRPWRDSEGKTPQVHVDGIALSHDGEFLYCHALTGRTLYRIATAVLRDPAATSEQVAAAIEPLARTVVTDGMEIDAEGNVYHTALEHDAIVRYTPAGELQTIVRDYSIIWPDSIAVAPDGWLYFTTSQIHQMPRFNEGKSRRFDPYRVMKVSLVPPPPEPEPVIEPDLDADAGDESDGEIQNEGDEGPDDEGVESPG
jgi:sugar lactone lactonase YvrE